MKFYVIAGEASGDLHGANLARALQAQQPDVQLRGMGGDRLAAAGMHLVRHNAQDNHMGIVEVVRHLPSILRLMRNIEQDILAWQPDAVVLIDYPGFNLRLAKFCHKHGIRVFYYISPQVWAWKAGRAKQLAEYSDQIYTILPFEQGWFAQRGIEVVSLGHPLLDAVAAHRSQPDTLHADLGLDPAKPILAILPGSRVFEIKNLLPIFLEAALPYRDRYQLLIAQAPNQPASLYQPFLQGHNIPLVQHRTYDILRVAHAAIVTSGTATLETALFGVPQLMAYKANALTYRIGRWLVDIKYAALPNLILDREIIRELWQGDANVDAIREELDRLLTDEAHRQAIQAGYQELRNLLGNEGASARVAQHMLARLHSVKADGARATD